MELKFCAQILGVMWAGSVHLGLSRTWFTKYKPNWSVTCWKFGM